LNKYLPLILSGVLLNAMAQLALKQGMRKIGAFDFKPGEILAALLSAATNPFIFIGLVCYVISVGIWLLVLSRVEVSYAYPLLSIGYIVTAFAGYFFLNEDMGLTRCAGVLIICFGVWVITKTA